MFTPGEAHEIHAPKRYLHFAENAAARVFTDAANPECPAANWAVLKDGHSHSVAQALAFCEEQFARAGAVPCFVWAPDAAPLAVCGDVLRQNGYEVRQTAVREFCTGAEESLDIRVNDCPVWMEDAPLRGAPGQLLAESCEGWPGRMSLLKKQLRAGARAFFAYNRAEIPVSVCLGFGYASAFRLFGLYTAPSQREKGYGMAALRTALRWAQKPEQGYEPFALVQEENEKAVRLMRRAGFLGRPQQRWTAVRDGTLPARQSGIFWL